MAHYHFYTQINSLHQLANSRCVAFSESLPLTFTQSHGEIPRPVDSGSMRQKGEGLAARSANSVISSSATESQRMPSNDLSQTIPPLVVPPARAQATSWHLCSTSDPRSVPRCLAAILLFRVQLSFYQNLFHSPHIFSVRTEVRKRGTLVPEVSCTEQKCHIGNTYFSARPE